MKSNKEKCIEMWEWIRDNNASKEDWEKAHKEQAEETVNLCTCYACLEAEKIRKSNEETLCSNCPIWWIKGHVGFCMEEVSPYKIWLYDQTPENAQAVINITKKTWKK